MAKRLSAAQLVVLALNLLLFRREAGKLRDDSDRLGAGRVAFATE